jgi:RNA polymerase sigma-70 factor, ECF subfamily
MVEPPVGISTSLIRIADPNDRAAWSWLVEHYLPHVLSLAYRIVRDPHVAEDCAQTAFMRMPRAALHFRRSTDQRDERAHAYILRLACNEALLALRIAKRERRRRVPINEAQQLVNHGSDRSCDDENRSAVMAALGKLRANYREPIVEHYILGRPYEDIARDSGCTVDNARMRAHRGILRMRKLLRAAILGVGVAGLETALASEPIAVVDDGMVGRVRRRLRRPQPATHGWVAWATAAVALTMATWTADTVTSPPEPAAQTQRRFLAAPSFPIEEMEEDDYSANIDFHVGLDIDFPISDDGSERLILDGRNRRAYVMSSTRWIAIEWPCEALDLIGSPISELDGVVSSAANDEKLEEFRTMVKLGMAIAKMFTSKLVVDGGSLADLGRLRASGYWRSQHREPTLRLRRDKSDSALIHDVRGIVCVSDATLPVIKSGAKLMMAGRSGPDIDALAAGWERRISIDSLHSLAIGDRFSVYRAGVERPIATIEIETVERNRPRMQIMASDQGFSMNGYGAERATCAPLWCAPGYRIEDGDLLTISPDTPPETSAFN